MTQSPLLTSHINSLGVLTLTLNRPDHFNALSLDLLQALQDAIDRVDENVRVLVIAANGKAFCAGHDLKEMRAHADAQTGGEIWQRKLFDNCSHVMQSLLSLPQPVIAKVQGVAAAAGCQLVANCDMAIAADNARFGVSGINLGLFCSTPAVALSRNISRKRAFRMLMTGEYIDAETAANWGLVNQAVPADELDTTMEKLCHDICSKSKVAVSTGKSMFYQQLESPTADAYALASGAMACNMMASDASEGIDAFFEKRDPAWSHR